MSLTITTALLFFLYYFRLLSSFSTPCLVLSSSHVVLTVSASFSFDFPARTFREPSSDFIFYRSITTLFAFLSSLLVLFLFLYFSVGFLLNGPTPSFFYRFYLL